MKAREWKVVDRPALARPGQELGHTHVQEVDQWALGILALAPKVDQLEPKTVLPRPKI